MALKKIFGHKSQRIRVACLTLILTCSSILIFAQKKRVLFLGNSYTAANNLPQMTVDVAASVNDTLIFDSNTPGGQTLFGHSQDPGSLNKIKSGNWNYVVLQAQSQEPSLPTNSVITKVFPYAHFLDSMIDLHNVCGQTMFYMTWGRKNGDAINCSAYPNWQYVCSYKGMDSLLNLRYRMMADSNKAIVSPVGAVWNFIRTTFPLIELYSGDESHPSEAGTYAAACCFYTAIFRKNPSLITFNSTLPPTDAAMIRYAAKAIVFDSLMKWNIGKYDNLLSSSCFASGVFEISPALNLKMYPNPVKDKLVLAGDDDLKGEIVKIMNTQGQLIQQQAGGVQTIDVSLLPSGLYFIRVGSYFAKFIKD